MKTHMLRHEWQFDYTASKLATASKAKIEVHKKKFDWWEAKKAETMERIKATGIQIHDSVASTYSNVKGGYGPQIEIEAGMQRDLSECQSKILEHHRLIREYEGWLQVFEANPQSGLKLHHDDWLFFFGDLPADATA